MLFSLLSLTPITIHGSHLGERSLPQLSAADRFESGPKRNRPIQVSVVAYSNDWGEVDVSFVIVVVSSLQNLLNSARLFTKYPISTYELLFFIHRRGYIAVRDSAHLSLKGCIRPGTSVCRSEPEKKGVHRLTFCTFYAIAKGKRFAFYSVSCLDRFRCNPKIRVKFKLSTWSSVCR